MNFFKKILNSFFVLDETLKNKINICQIMLGIATLLLALLVVINLSHKLKFRNNGKVTFAIVKHKFEDNGNYDYFLYYEVEKHQYEIRISSDADYQVGKRVKIYYLVSDPSRNDLADKIEDDSTHVYLIVALLFVGGIFLFGIYDPDFIDDHCNRGDGDAGGGDGF